MLKKHRVAYLVLALLLLAAGFGNLLRPNRALAAMSPALDLELMIPHAFGDWNEVRQPVALIVDPRQQQTLERTYAQILQRVYVNRDGDRLMLSISYGTDQRRDMAVHFPEVCYPAQGFNLMRVSDGVIETTQHYLQVRRLETQFGNDRHEPVTYWMTVGDAVVIGSAERRLAELRYGLKQIIPDGVLVRVSSIGSDTSHQFAVQEKFVVALLASLSREPLSRLVGVSRDH